MSRHHILPPIVYTPEPRPKKTESRPRTSRIQGVAASDEAGEAEEASEVFVSGTTARAVVHAPQDSFTPVESAERRIPSTTGKLSENTLKELLLAQEQESAPVAGIPDAER
jgi:hypothetical protein